MHKYEKPAIETCLPLYYSFINEVLMAFASKNIANPVNKFNHIAYSISLFKKLAFLDYFKKDYAVIFDEFIVHNIPITSDIQLLNKLFEKNDELKTRILPKAIIYCKSSLEENYNRRNKRIKSGTILFIDKNLSDENLNMSCKINLEEAEKKAVVMQELGVPVLSVGMEEDQSFNANKVLDFIRKLK